MPDNKPSWWQTVPGILTGLAAIITAATGLIVALSRTNARSEPAPAPAASREAAPSSTAESHPAAAAAVAAGSKVIPLPDLHQVKLAGGAAVITVLSVDMEPIDADRRSLKFRVRYMNNGRYQANFWAASFRLIVDGVPRSPTNSLNELVDGDSAKEGDAVFAVPLAVKDVDLQISSGEEKSRLSFKLP
jgi:hypothetical protein